tara:strand:+ start:20659 stop:22392 length:1734 start_codon:yes stop_codon:yes gene_type:complete
MENQRLHRYSLINLIWGYFAAAVFILMMILSHASKEVEIQLGTGEEINEEQLVIDSHRVLEHNSTPHAFIYSDEVVRSSVIERGVDRVYVDRLQGREINDERIIYKDRDAVIGLHDDHLTVFNGDSRIHSVDESLFSDGLHTLKGANRSQGRHNEHIDRGILDRRLRDLKDDGVDIKEDPYTAALKKDTEIASLDRKERGLDLSKLSPITNSNEELGDVRGFTTSLTDNDKGYGVGKGGELYAYNFPTQGVGAGIGSSSLGAGAGGGAGLGAAIGEGILNGEPVPTLGGVGDGAKTLSGEPLEPAGVGGLVGGAGAGGAAGLTQGYVTAKLGLQRPLGMGGAGGYGIGRGHNYEHLPKNAALHIMMHVDGSGSILNTRKQLDIMKDTLLKDALLPYYNNDIDLYNSRVTIVDDSGERTLRFFNEASKKDNVLAVVFQDEAQPAYHLPNFNKSPEGDYLDDLNKLKSNLKNHKGLYRGIMFQVDRGKTFAKSFKEFVGNAFQGEGYLSNHNLKKYYWQENSSNIKNKEGVVFSDEYHAKDEGDPQYYLNLLFNASKKVGLDLQSKGAGLTDGKYIKTN